MVIMVVWSDVAVDAECYNVVHHLGPADIITP